MVFSQVTCYMYIYSEQTSRTTTQRKQAVTVPINTPPLEQALCKNFQLDPLPIQDLILYQYTQKPAQVFQEI